MDRYSQGASYDAQIDKHFVLSITPPQLDFSPASKSVIAPVFPKFLIIRSKSVLEHFDVAAVHVVLGNFRF